MPRINFNHLPPIYSDKSKMSFPENFSKSLQISHVKPIAIRLINMTLSHAEGPADCIMVSGMFIII